jgi:hypothetical protein
MLSSFLRELAVQRRSAEAWLRRAEARGDDLMADIARERLADLERIAARCDVAIPA